MGREAVQSGTNMRTLDGEEYVFHFQCRTLRVPSL